MREIKFRAWDNLRKQMCDVVCLNCHRNDEHILKRQEPIPCVSNECYNVDADAIDIMQYTGLEDKKGKEIYEGDIVKFDRARNNSIVVWNIDKFSLKVETQKGARCYSGMWSAYSFIDPENPTLERHEVIGNIHENPELLP